MILTCGLTVADGERNGAKNKSQTEESTADRMWILDVEKEGRDKATQPEYIQTFSTVEVAVRLCEKISLEESQIDL
jgi:hypothetical protein